MNIQEIKVSECAAFQDNPFQVRDDEGMELIYSESFDGDGVSQAVMNRLLKAAGHRMIDV